MTILEFLSRFRSINKNNIHKNKHKDRIGAFISIPKNASHSVRKILELGLNRNNENTSSLIIYENHQRARVLYNKYDLSNLFVFCFSRNPYDRCVSWYEYHKNGKHYRSLSFDSWVKKGMPHHWKVQNKTNYVKENISPLLQYNYVEDYKIDFVGKVENFSNDLNIVIGKLNCICKKKGLTHRFKYSNKRLNKTTRKPEYENYYNQETRQRVYSLLKKDFEYFGYEK